DGGKQRQHRNAQFQALFGNRQQCVNGMAHDTRHGWHGLTDALAFRDEDRVDQVIYRQGMLPHQTAGEVIATIAPWSSGRKIGVWQESGHCSSRKPSQGTTVGEIQFSICLVASSSPRRWVAEKATACRVPRSDSSFFSAAMARTRCP